jgi:hypothetical protein
MCIYIYVCICIYIYIDIVHLSEKDARMPVQNGIFGAGSWSQINSMWGTSCGEAVVLR